MATGLTEDYHPLFGVVDQERYDKCDVEQTRSVNSEGPNDNDDDFGVDDFSSEDGIAPGLEVRALRHRIYSPSWSRLKNYTRCTHRSALRALNYSARNRRTYRRALRGASFYSPLPPVEATVPPASSNLCGTSGCVLLDGHMGPHMIHARGVCDFVEVQPNYTSAAAMRRRLLRCAGRRIPCERGRRVVQLWRVGVVSEDPRGFLRFRRVWCRFTNPR